MKKVFLIGDSIRQGYDKYTAEKLRGEAEVCFVSDNAQFTEYTLRHLGEWKDRLNLDTVDVVHWNVGLWDTLRLYGDFETLTSPEVYADNIRRIQKRLMFYFPTAKYIFATSTPVWEEKFDTSKAIRYNRDIERFNAIALDVLADFPVAINDLYTLMAAQPLELHSDCTHYYNPEATELIGSQVCRHIRAALEA